MMTIHHSEVPIRYLALCPNRPSRGRRFAFASANNNHSGFPPFPSPRSHHRFPFRLLGILFRFHRHGRSTAWTYSIVEKRDTFWSSRCPRAALARCGIRGCTRLCVPRDHVRFSSGPKSSSDPKTAASLTPWPANDFSNFSPTHTPTLGRPRNSCYVLVPCTACRVAGGEGPYNAARQSHPPTPSKASSPSRPEAGEWWHGGEGQKPMAGQHFQFKAPATC